MMKIILLIALLFSNTLSLCCANDDTLDLKVTLIQSDKLEWRVRYDFKSPQTALFFWRSLGDYRTLSWAPISNEVHIERINDLDTIWFDRPRSSAEFLITPYSQQISAEYTPFMKFGNGSFGVFTGQFDMAMASSKEQIKKLNGNTDKWDNNPQRKQLTIKSPQKLISGGQLNTDSIIYDFSDGGKYIYVGDGQIIESDHYIGVIDSTMPEWVRTQLNINTAIIFDTLSQLYQQKIDQKIELLYSFNGTEHSGFSNKGSILGGHAMVLESSGAMFLSENSKVTYQLQKTLAHEAAHLFQNAKALPSSSTSSWIHEGGAEVVTLSALHQAKLMSSKEVDIEVQKVYKLCTDYLKEGTINNSVKNRRQAHYHCGQIIGYITDAALIKHTYFDFWRVLMINAERPEHNKHYSAETYFQTMLELGADKDIIRQIKKLVSKTVDQPNKTLSKLMLKSGLNAQFNDKGELIKFKLP